MNIFKLNSRGVNLFYTNITLIVSTTLGIIIAQADKQTFLGMAILITTLWMLFLGAWMYNIHKK